VHGSYVDGTAYDGELTGHTFMISGSKISDFIFVSLSNYTTSKTTAESIFGIGLASGEAVAKPYPNLLYALANADVIKLHLLIVFFLMNLLHMGRFFLEASTKQISSPTSYLTLSLKISQIPGIIPQY
jgi:hypothetical protein